MRLLQLIISTAAVVAALPTMTSHTLAARSDTGETREDWSNRVINTGEQYEMLKDQELRLGGLIKDDHQKKKELESRLIKHRENFLYHHEGSTRRKKERELFQKDIDLRTQQIDNLGNGTWREAKIDLLSTEIGELVAWKNNYDISERPPRRILDE